MLAVWIASFFVPAGVYDQDPETGAPVPGTYHELPDCGTVPPEELCSDKSLDAQFGILWRSTPNGLYGIENTTTRLIGADESGFLYGSAQIFLFVLAVGAFITIAMKTGAIEAGIGRLAMRFGKKRLLLVLVLMSVFTLGGTTYGMWEETLGFYALMVPLVLALGYDRVVAVGIIAVGAGTGVLASTVNPFATGVASDAAGDQHQRRDRSSGADAPDPRTRRHRLRDVLRPTLWCPEGSTRGDCRCRWVRRWRPAG